MMMKDKALYGVRAFVCTERFLTIVIPEFSLFSSLASQPRRALSISPLAMFPSSYAFESITKKLRPCRYVEMREHSYKPQDSSRKLC